jgi:uncharacterized membrane protein YcfT
MIKYYDDVMSHNANMQPFNEFIYPFIIHFFNIVTNSFYMKSLKKANGKIIDSRLSSLNCD